MSISTSQIAEIERINYQATAILAATIPGLDLQIRDDVIITSSEIFPLPDTTHACLLQTTASTADNLITEITTYFQAKKLPPAIFVSPACTPPDLAGRLQRQGYRPQTELEAWLIFEGLLNFVIPPLNPQIAIEQITPATISTFVKPMLAAFDMPAEMEPFMTQLTAPSVGLPGIFHFVAQLDEQPIGTCSIICHQQVGILGGVGVVPAHRGSRAVTNLVYQAGRVAQAEGVDTLLLQTTAGTTLERLLRIGGFKRMFTRVAYTLTNEQQPS